MPTEQKALWDKLYSEDGNLCYEGFVLNGMPYGSGTSDFANHSIYQEGIFDIKGLVNGREYYPSGKLRFEGIYRICSGYGPNYPIYGRCFDEQGNLYFEGKLTLRFGGVGYPIIVNPTEYGPVPQSSRPKINYLMWKDAKQFDYSTKRMPLKAYEEWSWRKDYSINLSPEPMKKSAFSFLVSRALEQMIDQKNDYLTIGYSPVREDKISCIQASRTGNLYHVEIIRELDDGQKFHIWAKDDLPFDEAIEHFKTVCVDYLVPELSVWNDITKTANIIIKGDSESFLCPICGKYSFSRDVVDRACPECGWQYRSRKPSSFQEAEPASEQQINQEKYFEGLGFERYEFEYPCGKYVCYEGAGGFLYRVSQFGSSFVIEYAEDEEEARDNCFEEADVFNADLDEEELVKQIRTTLRYYSEE